MNKRNMYYSEGIDLQKMREDAQKSLDGIWGHEPQETIIHHHKFVETCSNRDHDYYSFETKEKEDGTSTT